MPLHHIKIRNGEDNECGFGPLTVVEVDGHKLTAQKVMLEIGQEDYNRVTIVLAGVDLDVDVAAVSPGP